MNTDYAGGSAVIFDPQSNSMVEAPGTFGAGRTGVDLMQLFVNVSYAWQADDNLNLGVSLIGAVQRFRAQGLAPFANVSLDPERLTDNGHDMSYGFGLKVGLTYDVSDDFSFGLSYQTEQAMSEFDDYAGLFAEGGDFDLPATYTVGIAYDIAEDMTFMVDYQGILYEGVPSVSNPISNLVDGSCFDALNNTLFSGMPSPASGTGCLGGSNGAGFGWNDMDVIILGLEHRDGNDTYRYGLSITDQPIDPSEVNFNLIAPGVIEYHLSFGYTTLIDGDEWTFFGMYMPSEEVTGTSLFDPGQTISFKMHQFELGFAFKF